MGHAKFRLDPSNRLTTVHLRYRQTGQTERKRTDSTGRTVLQTVAQKSKEFFQSYNHKCTAKFLMNRSVKLYGYFTVF